MGSFGKEGIYRPRYCINCRRKLSGREICKCGMKTEVLEQTDDHTITFKCTVKRNKTNDK